VNITSMKGSDWSSGPKGSAAGKESVILLAANGFATLELGFLQPRQTARPVCDFRRASSMSIWGNASDYWMSDVSQQPLRREP
jgi:hypothetical protein